MFKTLLYSLSLHTAACSLFFAATSSAFNATKLNTRFVISTHKKQPKDSIKSYEWVFVLPEEILSDTKPAHKAIKVPPFKQTMPLKNDTGPNKKKEIKNIVANKKGSPVESKILSKEHPTNSLIPLDNNPPLSFPKGETQEGSLVADLVINSKGYVISVECKKSSLPPYFEEHIKKILMQWRFKVGGTSPSFLVQIPIEFKLEDT